MSSNNGLHLPRRKFIQAAGGVAGALIVSPAIAKQEQQKGARTIALHNLHTGEKNKVDYWIDGAYDPEALAELDKLLRDHRSNEICTIDTQLIDLLHDVQQKVERNGKPFEVISGYRSPTTNAKLREKSRKVAKNSYHMQGKAVDVQIKGCDSRDLFEAARALKGGGVGFYGSNRFVHVDVGSVRSWGRK